MSLFGALLMSVQAAPAEPVQIVLKRSDKDCAAMVDGAPIDWADLEKRAVDWALTGRGAELSGDENASYRCIGGLIFVLQKAGFSQYFDAGFTPGFRMRFYATIRLFVSAKCEITVNGGIVSFAEYDRLAAEWGRNQAEIHFQPDPKSEFECVDRTLAVLRQHNATKLGFIGNEQAAGDPAEDGQ
ncbi:hypothetical protein P1X14_07565 [Sphingomonas sp. AOB5]|uniref:ExbD/TolR family protein n=1 Tax=Sphingomonas sp. AOB5 TaxID=3034017 RepID=UPI0023F720FE|nr:hypothetical protein [Sphingomonas sp. AOB5]MDF7775099.1 hypothetical protein [Sphingomonas sp. AOB5]